MTWSILIDEKTRGIIVNNPGNPCGNVFSKEHILDILDIAERHKLPIISDEVYEFFVFPGVDFHSVVSLSKNVPVLTCSSLSKRFLVPGIRMGWIIINDRHGALKDVKQGLQNVTGRILGPNSTVQYALPEILRNTPQNFFDDTMIRIAVRILKASFLKLKARIFFQRHASIAYINFMKIPGLKPILPKGAMYMMIKIELEKFPEYSSCQDFTEGLIQEQSVLLFPSGPCFNFPGFMRIVLTVTEEMIIEACERIKEFSERHIQL